MMNKIKQLMGLLPKTTEAFSFDQKKYVCVCGHLYHVDPTEKTQPRVLTDAEVEVLLLTLRSQQGNSDKLQTY